MAEEEGSALKIVLADFGEWSKPINTLIEKCADAIGGLAEPYQVTRLAQAHAKADEIAALSDIKINTLLNAERRPASSPKKRRNS